MTRRFLRIHIVSILMIAVSLVCIAHGFTEGTSVSSSTEDTVLRSSTTGVYKSASETIHLPGDSTPRMLCINIDTLLDETQKETGLLTAGQYMLEVYVQGQLFCVQGFIVK